MRFETAQSSRPLPRVATYFVAFQAEHLRDVVKSDAIGIAVDEEHRRFRGLECFRAKVARLEVDRNHALDEVREFVRRRANSLVVGFDGRTLEGFGRHLREYVEGFLALPDPAPAGPIVS